MSDADVDQIEDAGLVGGARDIAVAISAVLVGAAIAWYSQSLPPAPGGGAGSGLFPTIIGGILAGAGVILGARAVVGVRRIGAQEQIVGHQAAAQAPGSAVTPAPSTGDAGLVPALAIDSDPASGSESTGSWSDAVAVLAAIAFYVVLIEPLGFLITMSVVQFGLLFKFGNRMVSSIAISVISTAILYFLFGQLLYVPLQNGLLG